MLFEFNDLACKCTNHLITGIRKYLKNSQVSRRILFEIWSKEYSNYL
jgi:hypothetical protein